jgi:hypothetical protein
MFSYAWLQCTWTVRVNSCLEKEGGVCRYSPKRQCPMAYCSYHRKRAICFESLSWLRQRPNCFRHLAWTNAHSRIAQQQGKERSCILILTWRPFVPHLLEPLVERDPLDDLHFHDLDADHHVEGKPELSFLISYMPHRDNVCLIVFR